MNGNIPVLHVQEVTPAAAYEAALVQLYDRGVGFRTQYDRPGDPMSIDCTMSMTVMEPLSDPMIHRAIPVELADLKAFADELQGGKTAGAGRAYGPHEGTHPYTCYERLWKYGDGEHPVDQVEFVVDRLARQPFTRQAQMTAWMPEADRHTDDPPSLQSLWYRLLENERGGINLNCNVRFRSNDAWGAAFINLFGFCCFNRDVMAPRLSARLGTEVQLGRMHWLADSFHIYGRDIREVERRLIHERPSQPFAHRVLSMSDPEVQALFGED